MHYFYSMKDPVSFDEFQQLDLRVGTIIKAENFPEARKPAYKLVIDFGALGTKNSSAQITDLYSPEKLQGRQVIAIINFPPKKIAGFISECLVLGAIGDNGKVVLLATNAEINNGSQIS
jgi:tRNA-binding protein